MIDVERVSSDDLMSLATVRGAVPMQVGAILILDTSAGCDLAAVHRSAGIDPVLSPRRS